MVALDGLAGATLGVTTLALIGADEGGAALVTGLLGAAFIGAALHGNSTVNECQAAFAEARYTPPTLSEDRIATRPLSTPLSRRPVDPYGEVGPVLPAGSPHALPAPSPISPVPPAPATTPGSVPAPAAGPAKPAAGRPMPPPVEEDWSSFWKELP